MVKANNKTCWFLDLHLLIKDTDIYRLMINHGLIYSVKQLTRRLTILLTRKDVKLTN